MDTKHPVCALLLLGVVVAAPVQAAHYFESSSTTETDGPGGPIAAQVRGWIDGERARIEFVSGQAVPFAQGGYMLSNDGGKTLYLVNPAERTYSQFDIEQMLGMAGSMMQAMGGAVRLEFSDVVNEKLAEEPGGSILGHSTTHYRYRNAYTLSMGIMGFKRSNRVDTEQEFWCTSAFDDAGFKAWLSPDRYRTGSAELDELVRVQYQQLDCLPLRSRITTVSKTDGSPDSRTVATSEVTTMREESAPAGTFDLPADFTATEMLPKMPDMSQLPGAAPAADGGAEAPAESGRRPRLRDFLPGGGLGR